MIDKNTINDIVEIVGKTALSTIPVGGALVTAVYDTVKGNVLQKRQEKWKSVVEERLSKLEATLEDISQNDGFATTLIRTTELAMKTSKNEKIELLANSLIYSLKNTIDEDKLIIFLSFVDKYSVSHIKILTFFNEPLKFVTNNFYMGSPSQVLNKVFPEVQRLSSPESYRQ